MSTSIKMSPFLNFFILKGPDPSTVTMALFIANGDSFYKGLSLYVPFTSRNRGHEQICMESEFVIMKLCKGLILFLSVIWEFCETIML